MLKKMLSKYRLKKAMVKEAELNNSHFEKAVLSWETPLRHKPQKGAVWLVLSALALSGILYYAIVSQNWFFAIAMMIAVVAYGMDHFEDTPMIEVKMSEFGVKVGKKNIAYAHIRAFWIIYHTPFVERLYIRTYQKTMPDIIIELNGMDPTLIRKHLTRHVVEWEGKEEGFMDLFVRLLKL